MEHEYPTMRIAAIIVTNEGLYYIKRTNNSPVNLNQAINYGG